MLKPFDAILIKKPERQEQTASGIILPDTAAEQATAEDRIQLVVFKKYDTGEPIPLKEGDRIIYSKFSAQKFNKRRILYCERDIVAVVMK